MGSARFLSLLIQIRPIIRRQSRETSSVDRNPHFPALAPVIPDLNPKIAINSHRQIEVLNRSSSPRAHPPFEAFPSDSAVPSSPFQFCVATAPNATEWPTPRVVVWCVLLPCSIESVAGFDFPQPLVHLTQPQGIEPSPSPLHPHIVSDVSMPAAPLGFSSVGSPTPWQCAFESE
jgi:hypothetical protein